MDLFPKKENDLDFSLPDTRKGFVENTRDSHELLQKELNVNQVEQQLLKERIRLTTGFINDIPSSDPQYSMLCVQVKMDQIELDELKSREEYIVQKLTNLTI